MKEGGKEEGKRVGQKKEKRHNEGFFKLFPKLLLFKKCLCNPRHVYEITIQI